ncbi:MAG TPA: ATP-binding cassette domain-containing protein [Chthoniobacteraceae bacterium]|nr:ATP-binding cassette domain-containing protein [Chthoniobacteraceae bacterium]
MSCPSASALEVRDLVCRRGPVALRATHAAFVPGVFHLLQGAPDSGHELLLRVLGLLELPDAGDVLVEENSTRDLGDEARLKLRERRLGFVFAAPFLLPAFSVIENVAMPLFKISDVNPPEARQRSEALLEFAGLLDLAQTPCAELAPLAQHRAALARALVNDPAALLVEALDSTLADVELRVFAALLRQAAASFSIAVIAAASPRFVPDVADRVIEVRDGAVLCRDELSPKSEA